jgi:hypothetical protein
MTPLINWLALITFALTTIFLARWVVGQSLARWQGKDTLASRAFLYALIVSTIGGVSFIGVSVLYYEILYTPEFLRLSGMSGVLKFLLMFTGVWYGIVYMLKAGKGGPAP